MRWQPHEKSFSLGGLATHLSEIPRWGTTILGRDRYDLSESDVTSRATELTAVAEVLDTFDRHAGDVRRMLADLPEGSLAAPWTLGRGARTLMSMPRASAFRSFVINHTIHHRGQLTVYLRLQNVPLPPVYGPTADERM